MRIYDVIVVGAGPAGSALAIHLAQDGYAVLLLDQHQFPRDKVCGDLVSARGLKLLDELGCLQSVSNHGYFPITGSLVCLDGERLATGKLPELPDHPPYGHAVPRVVLDEIVYSQAVAAGADSIENCRVVGFQYEGSLVSVAAETGGQSSRILGRMIVGADGAGSIVARNADMEMRDPRYTQLAIRAYCNGGMFDSATLYFAEDFFPGYGWVFPVTGDQANIGVGMVKESIQKDGIRLREFYARLKDYVVGECRKRGAEVELTRPSGWPIKTYGGAQRNFFDRGLLVGDAGCFVDPISGEGIPLALETAVMAADTIREAFASGDLGSDSLAGYETRWRRRFDADLAFSDLIVSMARNRHLVRFWVRWLRTIAKTAESDPDYAAKTGGVLAGLLPNREGLSADVLMKSVMHGPAFWLDVLGLSNKGSPGDLPRRGAQLLSREAGLASSMVRDVRWVTDWMAEIGSKQLQVLGALAGRSSPDA